MADLSFPLDKPLSPLEMKRRLLRLNGKLHAVRKWKDPQADKAIHLLVKDNIGVTGFPTSAGSHALKDLELPDAFCIQRLRRNPKIEIFGKTHLTELAGFVTSNVLFCPRLHHMQLAVQQLLGVVQKAGPDSELPLHLFGEQG